MGWDFGERRRVLLLSMAKTGRGTFEGRESSIHKVVDPRVIWSREMKDTFSAKSRPPEAEGKIH